MIQKNFYQHNEDQILSKNLLPSLLKFNHLKVQYIPFEFQTDGFTCGSYICLFAILLSKQIEINPPLFPYQKVIFQIREKILKDVQMFHESSDIPSNTLNF